jgi:hypothetical protein
MADLAITSAVFLDGYAPIPVKAGAAIAATDVVYVDTTDSTAKLATANASASSQAVGMSLNAGATGNPVHVAGAGSRITVNAVLTKGVAYYLSATSGKLCPFVDLVAGKYISLFGIADSTTVLAIIASNRLVTV